MMVSECLSLPDQVAGYFTRLTTPLYRMILSSGINLTDGAPGKFFN